MFINFGEEEIDNIELERTLMSKIETRFKENVIEYIKMRYLGENNIFFPDKSRSHIIIYENNEPRQLKYSMLINKIFKQLYFDFGDKLEERGKHIKKVEYFNREIENILYQDIAYQRKNDDYNTPCYEERIYMNRFINGLKREIYFLLDSINRKLLHTVAGGRNATKRNP